MTKELIARKTKIAAPPRAIWDVLTEDSLNRLWFAEFEEGTRAETDWQKGSKVIFADNLNSGLIGTLLESLPNEKLIIKYQGILNKGVEDYESEEAQNLRGGLKPM